MKTRNLRSLSITAQYQDALARVAELESHLRVLEALTQCSPVVVRPHHGAGTSEATPVIVASDWHLEERVGKEVGGLNTFNLDIARERVQTFWQASLRLAELLHKDVHIHTVVFALLGDYITNQIHGAESAESNELQPIHAIIEAQNLITGGIDFWLNNTSFSLVIVCKSGNHARTTQFTRFTSETGHSLEYLMFVSLQAYYRNEPRISFIIEPGIHSYLPIYDEVLRFHHGHAIRYAGGVGGITIPVNKAIAEWDKGRQATFDVFGHYHQYTIGSKFLCNGSLIGYNGYAMSIKAPYEPPKQALFLLDKKRGRTCHWPILFRR